MADASATVMLLRHAEKPGVGAGPGVGVDALGCASPSSLTVRGWQRAGALAALLAGGAQPGLPVPAQLFAAASTAKSSRCAETLAPLAGKLALAPDLRFARGQERELARTVATAGQAVLVCWKHEGMPELARRLADGELDEAIPDVWPEDRFDVIWRLTRADGQWRFTQFVQCLLGGDSQAAIA